MTNTNQRKLIKIRKKRMLPQKNYNREDIQSNVTSKAQAEGTGFC
jgi:hypothetical protein